MDFQQIARTYMNEYLGSKTMGLSYLNNIDIDICEYVLEQIPNDIDIQSVCLGNIISLWELKSRSLDEIKIFGDDNVLRINNLMNSVVINNNEEDLFYFSTYVVYSLNDDGSVCLDSGRVDSYQMPVDLYEISTFSLCHEHIHALKDVNYSEYVNSFVLGETISLFYELINCDKNIKKEYVKMRLYNLNNDRENFIISNDLFNNALDEEDRLLFEHIRSKVGVYLNSFYYAIILYNMYKDSPKKILNLISRVLRHEITTLELLKMLDIYGDIRSSIFEKELGNIKRLIR